MIIIKLKYICHYIIYPRNIASYVLQICLSTIREISENVVCMSCAVMILVHVVYIGCHGHRIHWRNQPGWLFGDEYVEMYDIFRRPFCWICDRFGSVSLCTVYGDSRVPENWHRWIFMDSDQIIASSPCQSLWLPLHVNPLDGHAHLPCTSSCCQNNINWYTIPCNIHSFDEKGSQILHDIVHGDTISDHIVILCNGINIMTAHNWIGCLKFIADPGDNTPSLF